VLWIGNTRENNAMLPLSLKYEKQSVNLLKIDICYGNFSHAAENVFSHAPSHEQVFYFPSVITLLGYLFPVDHAVTGLGLPVQW
jgi:hypothetical protein